MSLWLRGKFWANEAQHFTPWLLQNADVLSDLLGMDLALEVAEHPVGGFSLDLIGKDEATGTHDNANRG